MKPVRRGLELKIVRLTKKNAAAVAGLWRRCLPGNMSVTHGNPSGKAMTARRLEQRVLSREGFDPGGSFVAVKGNRVVGFCLAAAGSGRHRQDGFLCGIAVMPRLRRQGIGSILLRRAERYLAGRGARHILTTFEGNPVALGLGAPTDAEAYPFLLNRGFRSYDRNLLLVMRQDASRFRLSEAMRRRIEKLVSNGIRIGRFEPGDLKGLDALMKSHFPEWRRGVVPPARAGASIIVAARGKKVLGFSGPFRVTDSGNGSFACVGVDPRERGRGIGAAIFNIMCEELRAGGAHFVVLTTGLANPAQEIYVRAGYRTLFVVDYGMRKRLASKKPGAARKRGARRR